MTYDLRRLRLKGLVTRVEHTNTYTMSESGIRFSVTYTKLGHRVLPPLLAADHPRHQSSSAGPSGSSTTTSRSTLIEPASGWLPENLPQL
jgi:hypothetical protein